MPALDITIVRLTDPPPWEDQTREFLHLPDSLWRVALLEAGMQSGAPSVALRLDLEGLFVGVDGRPIDAIIAETSLALFAGAVIAARGAFPRAFDGGPLEVRD